MDFEIMSGIIKTDISDHCAILGAIKVNGRYQSNNVINKGKIYNFKYQHKIFKNLFQKRKKNAKMFCYQDRLSKFQADCYERNS